MLISALVALQGSLALIVLVLVSFTEPERLATTRGFAVGVSAPLAVASLAGLARHRPSAPALVLLWFLACSVPVLLEPKLRTLPTAYGYAALLGLLARTLWRIRAEFIRDVRP
jgi:hypothetical protein